MIKIENPAGMTKHKENEPEATILWMMLWGGQKNGLRKAEKLCFSLPNEPLFLFEAASK